MAGEGKSRGEREKRVEGEEGEEGGGSQVYREWGEGVDRGEVRDSSRGKDRVGERIEVSKEGDRGGVSGIGRDGSDREEIK